MLITAEQLMTRVKSGRCVVCDCRFSLADPDAGRAAYRIAHIPRAWHLDLENDLSGPVAQHGGRHPLPAADTLAAKLGWAGVDRDTQVVVYDDGGGMAARAWWLIRYLGHDHVDVLDGGWAAWLASGGETTSELPQPDPRPFEPRVRKAWVADAADVLDIVHGKGRGVLVDARAAERFRGEVEPLDPVAGHIPGACNVEWTDQLTPDGRWQPVSVLRSHFAAVVDRAGGIDRHVVAYCGSGVTACVNLFAMHLAGYPNAKLYAGSWSDWCSYAQHPVATGDESTDSRSR